MTTLNKNYKPADTNENTEKQENNVQNTTEQNVNGQTVQNQSGQKRTTTQRKILLLKMHKMDYKTDK